jgi:hypothetical protein
LGDEIPVINEILVINVIPVINGKSHGVSNLIFINKGINGKIDEEENSEESKQKSIGFLFNV